MGRLETLVYSFAFQPPPFKGNHSLYKYILSSDHSVACYIPLGLEYGFSNGCILYFHGNSSDATMIIPEMERVSSYIRMPIILMEYPSYGPLQYISTSGKPTEDTCIFSSQLIYNHILTTYTVPAYKISFWGYSIGGAIATSTISSLDPINRPCCLILESTFTSIKEVAYYKVSYLSKLIPKSIFNVKEKIQSATYPIVILHGDMDDISLEQARKNYNSIPEGKKRLIIFHGEGHQIMDPMKYYYIRETIYTSQG